MNWKKAMPIIKGVLFFLIFVILYILSMACMTYYHEGVHQQIFARFDIKSTVHYDFLWMGGQTIAEDYPVCKTECQQLHAWNEIIGYSLIAFSHMLWFLFWACMIWTMFREGK